MGAVWVKPPQGYITMMRAGVVTVVVIEEVIQGHDSLSAIQSLKPKVFSDAYGRKAFVPSVCEFGFTAEMGMCLIMACCPVWKILGSQMHLAGGSR